MLAGKLQTIGLDGNLGKGLRQTDDFALQIAEFFLYLNALFIDLQQIGFDILFWILFNNLPSFRKSLVQPVPLVFQGLVLA
jgi:hypothetical protein